MSFPKFPVMLRPVEQQWDHLAEEVRRRMTELRLTVPGLCAATGLSDTIIRSVINASKTSYRADTGYRITQALGWTPESWDATLRGDGPTLDIATLDAQMSALRERQRAESEVTVAADGIDLSELRRVDPAAYDKLMDDARWLLARARERRNDG